MARTNDRGRLSKNGSKWIRKDKRLAIYARDGYRCLWCGCEVVAKDNATLDHFLPASRGGCNLSTNVFTCCFTCNSSRGDMSALEFAMARSCLNCPLSRAECGADTLNDILTALDKPVERRLRR